MSEVKRYWCGSQHVLACDYDAAQSELAALREELASLEDEFDTLEHGNITLKMALQAAEQRNATLENLVRQFQGVAYGGFLDDDHLLRMQRDIDAALKPTESGESE